MTALYVHARDDHGVLDRCSIVILLQIKRDGIVTQKLIESVCAGVEIEVARQALHLWYGLFKHQSGLAKVFAGYLGPSREYFTDLHVPLQLYMLQTFVNIHCHSLRGHATDGRWGAKALIHERLHVYAKIEPLPTLYGAVGHPRMHLIHDYVLGTVNEHNSTAILQR